jgi:flagellar hook-associated protein 3 FlgL
MTRITSEMMVTGSLGRLSNRLEQYEKTQSRLATGRRLLVPSDAPGDANRSLGLRAVRRAREQEIRNSGDAMAWLDISDTQLQAATERLSRARELALRGASMASDGERSALATELANIRDELVGIANSRNRGRPLFSGFASTDAVTQVAGTWTYIGDAGVVERRVTESDVVQVNVTADEVFGFNAGPGADVFSQIDQLITDINAGNIGGVTAALGALDIARTRVTDAVAKVGASANTVESAQLRTEDTLMAIRAELSEVEDVDLAETVMELQTQQAAYEATLQALARTLPPSLASFLR